MFNITRDERNALKGIDIYELDKLIEQCFHDEHSGVLRKLHLEQCGFYVVSKLREYEKSLSEYNKAKSTKKRTDTAYSARVFGGNLAHAVQQMKHQVEIAEKEEQLFYVDDFITYPYSFNKHLNVRISYRWRNTTEDEWKYDSINYIYVANLEADYVMPCSGRKLSAAKQRQEQQEKLSREWEYLKNLCFCSVKEYFQNGGDGSKIPKEFRVVIDPYTQGLNNYSARFWIGQP
ncbi:TPA: hypothetical protein L9M67_003839 [Klebsiella quasipneumoniae subsp. quasipneumoniae]|nr:hypothetical protein [Klebsiella quasipneumoniae subsp. quasipneumoniae]